MVRQRRLMLRMYLIIVIVVALFGGWYASNAFKLETSSLDTLQMEDEGDWVDFFAALGEGAIQLFLGFTTE